jgi:hypothetical protein
MWRAEEFLRLPGGSRFASRGPIAMASFGAPDHMISDDAPES